MWIRYGPHGHFLSVDAGENFVDPLICAVIVIKELDDHTVRLCVAGECMYK